MNSPAEILADVTRNWPVYASMPFIAAAIGYVTKLVAIEMMFKPLEFKGRKPFLGWQGVVPRRAAKMAGIACDTMTSQLITPAEIFSRLDPKRVAEEIEKPLVEGIEEITRDVMAATQPDLWEALPSRVKEMVVDRVRRQSPRIVETVMQQIQTDINSVFDLKEMVVTNLVRDKALLNRIFREAGHKEFRFIANCGAPFGLAIGVLQTIAWAVFREPLLLPAFGLITGWATDWLALKMVFRPVEPRRFFGVFTWQGLFFKRRNEVARDYGDLIAKEIITPRNVVEAVLKGPLSDRLFALVQREVHRMVDSQSGMARPLVVMAVGGRRYQRMKQLVTVKVMERLPETMAHIEEYATDAMDIRNTLMTKMQQLTPHQFERLLRPAFEQDEWILIATGAMLGFMVGELQILVVEFLTR
ncbi:hypothetical protein GCM10023321_19130 [Pseudonocardia eucalypti]|uniref:DUF445 domain-containing protein n=2 Tax=Pseudonocardia eucalypti TaxID=648755 RepID=A0ABP9PW49_9PSEU|nr:uncharacterized membrane protein YheB (UPF0754 family) [Pseudonocardia eucalypti]